MEITMYPLEVNNIPASIAGLEMTLSPMSKNDVTLRINSKMYYISNDACNKLVKKAALLRFPQNSYNAGDPTSLGSLASRVHEKELLQQFAIKTESLLSQFFKGKNLDKKTLEKTSELIYKNCISKIHPNKGHVNPVFFKFTKNSVTLATPSGKPQDDGIYAAFTDSMRHHLFIRTCNAFAYGAVKKLYDFQSVPLIENPTSMTTNEKTMMCSLSATDELGFQETGLLNSFECAYIINAPVKIAQFTYNGRAFYEYLAPRASATLNGELVKSRNINYQTTLKYMLHVSKGLEYLHNEKQLVHADIKCGNILLYDGDIAKICDFGSCREVTTFKGGAPDGSTIRSPEIEIKTDNNETTMGFPHDMFAWGATLFELTSPNQQKPYFLKDAFAGFRVDEKDLKSNNPDHNTKLFQNWPTSVDKYGSAIQKLLPQPLELNYKERMIAGDAVKFIEGVLNEANSSF